VIEDLGVHMGRQVYMVQFMQNSHQQNGNHPATLVHPMPVDSDTYDLIRSLQEELNIARHEVQAGLEELETNNEELQAANEELVAANEELQSTNEELQSVNEELYTVNSELQVRNREISESKTLLDNLVSNMGSGVLFLDRGLNIRVFTPEFTQFVWLEETDIGMPIARFSMKWDFTDFVPNLRKILLDKQSTIEREVVLRGENESHVRHFLARLRPFLREGQVDGVIVFLIEITDRKKTEMALQAVEQNQRLILNSIPEYVSVVDVEGNLLYLNQSTQDLSEEDVQGQNLFSHVHPEDESLIREAFEEALETGKPVEYRNRTFLPGGAERTFANRVIRFRKEEHLSYDLMILSYDVSESYAEEKKVQTQMDFFNRYMDANSSYIWIKDKDFRYIYTNAAARKELLMSDQNYAGHNDFSIFPQDIANQLRNLDEQVFSKGKMIESIQHHPQKPDSDEMVLMILFPIKEGGQITHIGGMGLNITSLVKEYENIRMGQESMEEKVIERTTALVQANDDLRSFTRSIAHDLRSPIRAIFSYSQLLMDKPAPPVEQALEYAEKIHRQAQWTGQLIDSLMSFAKLGSVAVRKEWLDMQSIARRVYDDLSLQTEGRQIKFQIRNCPRIWGDIELTRQILTNLFSNAVKYTSRKENAEIEFGGYHDEHKFEIVYFVKDNGIGFDQKFASKIFKMFERLHIESEYEGSGIGLAIVRRAIELQNGSVWVTSQIGQGTTFYFSFPIKT
jgi:two-component system, chemotaxis family, CheB/CheR fusion protein